VGEPQHLFDLSHGQLSPGRHPILLVVEDWDAAVADPRGCAIADAGYRVAGFISEWWPTSNRNVGRLRVGMGGRLPSESALIAASAVFVSSEGWKLAASIPATRL
jgi:hypothetical protein